MAELPRSGLGATLREVRQRLAAAGIADPDLDARLLVEHVTATSRADAIARPEQGIDDARLRALEVAVGRRIGGEPVHRILGFREFHGLRIGLSPATLEPRPDTETLVDAVLPFVRQIAAEVGTCRILDLGTGSGAIALAIIAAVPEARADGLDIAPDALATAVRNAADAGLSERFAVRLSNWFAAADGRYHLIVSNPPYIRTGDIPTLPDEVRRHDPLQALDGGEDGLVAYREIALGARSHLESGGRVAVEIGAGQEPEVTALFQDGGFERLSAGKDLQGTIRVLSFRPSMPEAVEKKALGNGREYG